MKIVCESCGAKYSIADEKVAGKVFKIRCKRCSEVITVRGDQPAPAEEDPATRVYDYGPATAIWHVVVDGEQHGPYEPQQISEMLAASQIDWDTYVWRDGFDDWVPARNVEELIQAVTGQAGAPEAQPQYAAPPAAQPSMGADPFAGEAAAADAGGGDLFGEPAGAQPPADPGGAGLFGGQPAAEASPFGGEAPQDPGVVASSPGPRVSMDQAAMTGARNENSVLFSLKNLQALATGSEESGSSGSAPSQQQAGFASGEGSGLIDIRALAQTTGVNKDSSNGEGGEKVDDLLSMGSSTGAFGSLGSPMLAPAAAEEKSSNKTLIFAILGGFGILAAAVVVAVVMLKSDSGPQATQAVASGTPAAASGSAATAQGGGDQGEAEQAAAAAADKEKAEPEKAETPEPESEGAKAAEQASQKEEQDERQRAAERERERRRRSGRTSGSREQRKRSKRHASGSSSSSSSKKEEPEPEKTQKSSGSSGGDDIDSLLAGAIGSGGKKKRSAQSSSSKSNLPETPSRSQVLSALRRVQPAVNACAKGKSGVAMTAITVDGSSGRVKSAKVSGSFAGTSTGSCIARAVRKARFPKFKKSSFSVNFPFRL